MRGGKGARGSRRWSWWLVTAGLCVAFTGACRRSRCVYDADAGDGGVCLTLRSQASLAADSGDDAGPSSSAAGGDAADGGEPSGISDVAVDSAPDAGASSSTAGEGTGGSGSVGPPADVGVQGAGGVASAQAGHAAPVPAEGAGMLAAACVAGETRSCVAGKGVCAEGTQVCDGRRFGPCTSLAQAAPELCDGRGIDEDCNGLADAQDTRSCACVGAEERACMTGQGGVCATGTQVCRDGKWQSCVAARSAQPEVCDGMGADEDCDGLADLGDDDCQCLDGAVAECGNGLGECRKGTWTCTHGKWPGECQGDVRPTEEVCNGKDDDCSGRVDDGCPLGQSCMGAVCSAPLPGGNYRDSCEDCRADGILLTCGSCTGIFGWNPPSFVVYWGCRAVLNCTGTLRCQLDVIPGPWSSTCATLRFDGCLLSALCQDGQGGLKPAQFNYGWAGCDNLHNCGGVLKCGGC